MGRVASTIWIASTRVVPTPLRSRIIARLPQGFLSPPSFADAAAVFDRTAFERLYAESDDPYAFEQTERERRKFVATLAACGEGPFSTGLEVGCSNGVFTEMLAPRCRQLLAIDISAVAIRRARTRLAPYGNVRCERRTLPDELPEGPFDLVLCSDVLFYWPADAIVRGVSMIEDRLAPRGRLVCIHWARRPSAVHTGDEVHDILAACLGSMRRVESRRLDDLDYRLDVFEKPVTTEPTGAV